MSSTASRNRYGFTIVELLIVIVVIAILAAISVVAYSGIQQRARNAQRIQDVKTIAKAIELYYAENGILPNSQCSLGAGCKINSGWNTTADASWQNLESQLVPKYISSLPKDPQASTATSAGISGGQNYDFLANTASPAFWCSTSPNGSLMYLITYRLEGVSQERQIVGSCTGTQPTDYSSSEYFVIK